MPEPSPDDQLTQGDVAELAGIALNSLYRQRNRSPAFMPEPDGVLGTTPWWRRATIDDWLARRTGRGRPRITKEES